MNRQVNQTACPWLPHTSFRGPVRAQTPAMLSPVSGPIPGGRFSRMTWAASPPLTRKRRAVRYCPTLISDERHRCTSILTVDPISFSVYQEAVENGLPESAPCAALRFLCWLKPGSFLGEFS
jgi:hypothetical protein